MDTGIQDKTCGPQALLWVSLEEEAISGVIWMLSWKARSSPQLLSLRTKNCDPFKKRGQPTLSRGASQYEGQNDWVASWGLGGSFIMLVAQFNSVVDVTRDREWECVGDSVLGSPVLIVSLLRASAFWGPTPSYAGLVWPGFWTDLCVANL